MSDDQNQNLNQNTTDTPQEASNEETVLDETNAQSPEEAGIAEETPSEQTDEPTEQTETESAETAENTEATEDTEEQAASSDLPETPSEEDSPAKWYVVNTYSGHENRVAQTLKQRIESEHLEDKIIEVLVPTQDKIEIRSGKKETIKEKIFPGYILVKMILDDDAWLAVRTTQGVTSFVGMGNKPTPITEREVRSIVSFMEQGAQPTYKTAYVEGDTVKIVDGPFSEFIGKVDGVDKDRGKVKVLVSIFGRETPVELDFLQVQKL